MKRPWNMNHLLCPGCDTVIRVTEFPCPHCQRCASCGLRPESTARECTNCGHPNNDEATRSLLSRFGIPESSVAQARNYASHLVRLGRTHLCCYRIAVVACIVLGLWFRDTIRDQGVRAIIFFVVPAALTFVLIEVVFGVLDCNLRRKIARAKS